MILKYNNVMRATKIVSLVKPYKDRLKRLKLSTLKFLRIRGDIIDVYKAINEYYDRNTTITFDFVGNSVNERKQIQTKAEP